MCDATIWRAWTAAGLRRQARLLIGVLLVVAIGCGNGADGTPIASPTAAANPAPEPPPERPPQVTGIEVADAGQDFVLWTWDPVDGATGYEVHAFPAGTPSSEREGDRVYIRAIVEEPSVRVEGLEPSTAVELFVRAVRETSGGRAFGLWSDIAFAQTWAEPRECSDEREQALRFGEGRSGVPVLLREWDGTPFQFYFDAASVPEKDRERAEEILDLLENVFDQIEDEIGFPVLEVAGWAEIGGDFDRREDCEDWRPPGTITAGVTTREGASFAVPRCALIVWSNGEIHRRHNLTAAHEIFHLFGFTHSPESNHPWQTPPGVGYPMSVRLTNVPLTPKDPGVAFEDADALRCILEGGR